MIPTPNPYAPFMLGLPEVEVPVDGLIGHLVGGNGVQVVFFRAEKAVDLPEHAHCAQWGTVVTGRLTARMDGLVQSYSPGDRYFIRAGQPHAVRFEAGTCVIDVFDDPARYRVKRPPSP
ncbi:MAG TPA: cupin domain-containing protein [Deinococcales bacterium]|nr:cupin domain-containing protein [Deinococcales bacterium]